MKIKNREELNDNTGTKETKIKMTYMKANRLENKLNFKIIGGKKKKKRFLEQHFKRNSRKGKPEGMK